VNQLTRNVGGEPTSAQTSSAASAQCDALVDPYGVSHYLGLLSAIERFTAAAVESDPAAFRVQGADLRYAIERQLYFALVNDRALYRHFVARARGDADDCRRELSAVAAMVAPYFWHDALECPQQRTTIWRRGLRGLYRRYGRPIIRREGLPGDTPAVLFLVIQPKFAGYLGPIARALPVASGLLTINDPQMFGWLANQGLPRVGIELTARSCAMLAGRPRVAGLPYRTDPLDHLAVVFNAIRRALETLRPDCIVVPEGNAPSYELVNRAAKALSIPVLCIQQGWAPVVHNGFRRMSYSAFCAWGQGFVDLLRPHNTDQRFVVTGNHVVTCRRQGDDAGRHAVGFFLQKGAVAMTETAWTRTLEFIRWAAIAFPQTEMRVREHPGSPLSQAELETFQGMPNIKLTPPDQTSLDEVLAGCSVVVAVDSTTLLEGAATGAVPLILNVKGFDHYNPDIASAGGAIEVRDFTQAQDVLARLLRDEAYRLSFGAALERLRERFFARGRHEALAAIVEEIEKLRHRAGEGPAGARPRPA
jgi:hypothetical protein